MNAKYLYGIVKSGEHIPLTVPGKDGARQIQIVTSEGLGGVVSDCSGDDSLSRSKEETIQRLLTHQRVIEQVMKRQTVLPVKFGTVCASLDEVRALLSQGCHQFREALEWIEDKVEVEVAATWDLNRVLREVAATEEILRFKEEISAKQSPLLESSVQLGKLVKAMIDRRRDCYREQMIDCLKPIAVDVQANVLVSEALVLNVAFLINKADQDELDGRVRYLDDLFHGEMDFRVIGPLPPYSFAAVEIARPDLSRIEEARQLLSLEGAVSEPEVRKAYRRRAAEIHPDCSPPGAADSRDFARLSQMTSLLISYSRRQGDQDPFLIAIKRSSEEQVPHFKIAEPLPV